MWAWVQVSYFHFIALSFDRPTFNQEVQRWTAKAKAPNFFSKKKSILLSKSEGWIYGGHLSLYFCKTSESTCNDSQCILKVCNHGSNQMLLFI